MCFEGMATAGTLISDLDGKSPVMSPHDDDLVSKILADINASSPSNPVMTNQPPASMGRVINSPNPNTTYPTAIDPATASAHMIGKDYPTAADFANLMHSPSYSGHMMNGGGAPYGQPSMVQQPSLIPAVIVFIVSLPIINVLIGHYLPSLLRVGGDLTTAGMMVKALLGGFMFWFIQKVLVPLMAV